MTIENVDVHFDQERSRNALSDALTLIAAKSGDAGPFSRLCAEELSRLEASILNAGDAEQIADRLSHVLDAFAALGWAATEHAYQTFGIDRREYADLIETTLLKQHYRDPDH